MSESKSKPPQFGPSREFFDSAIATYGRQGAQEISQSILDSLQYAYDVLPMKAPIIGLGLAVEAVDIAPQLPGGAPVIQFFATHKTKAIELFMHPQATVADILDNMRDGMLHECAHIAHKQHNPKFSVGSRAAGIRHFADAVTEGIAQVAEDFHDTDFAEMVVPYHPLVIESKDDAELNMVNMALRDTLQDAHPELDSYAFLYGDEAFPHRGYEVGKYVVLNVMAAENCSLEYLMGKPLNEYRDFAEGLVREAAA